LVKTHLFAIANSSGLTNTFEQSQ